MRGENAQNDVQKAINKDIAFGPEINKLFGTALVWVGNKEADFVDRNTEPRKTWEFKGQQSLDTSTDLHIEWFAEVFPSPIKKIKSKEGFELGWIYRYNELDFIVFYSDKIAYIYDAFRFRTYFWLHVTKIGDEWPLRVTEVRNQHRAVIKIPQDEFDFCLLFTVDRAKGVVHDKTSSHSSRSISRGV